MGGEALLWGRLKMPTPPCFLSKHPPGAPQAACAEGPRWLGRGRPPPSPAGWTLGALDLGPLRGLHTMEWPRRKTGSPGWSFCTASTCWSTSRMKTWKSDTTILSPSLCPWPTGRETGTEPVSRGWRPRQAQRSPHGTTTTLQGGPPQPSQACSQVWKFSTDPKPILQIMKWKHREVKERAQDHTARR